tara:strand:- start:842 stop:1342 length:501 start_codon:yes stop_codon:yes gene_type:complete
MVMMAQYKFTIAYIFSIVLINIGFIYVPLIPFFDTMYPPMTLLVGLVFILRDYAQREVGHKVIIAMLVGALLSYFMADPFIAVASLVAFMVSETVDWGVYSITDKPIHQRILLSSFISTPIDSALFLYMLGQFSLLATVTMFVSKMLAAFIIWHFLRKDGNDYIQL